VGESALSRWDHNFARQIFSDRFLQGKLGLTKCVSMICLSQSSDFTSLSCSEGGAGSCWWLCGRGCFVTLGAIIV
jgi:hypothetical protein